MVKAILEQCLHETATHIRTLEYLSNENILLKERLTAVVQHSVNRQFIEKAEYFHHQFIMEDEAVKIMRHDVIIHEEALQVPPAYAEVAMSGIQAIQVRLRKEMESIEAMFHNLKFDFHRYLGEFLGLASQQVHE